MELTTDHRLALIERLNESRESLADISNDLRTENYTDEEARLLFEVDRAVMVAKIDFLRDQLKLQNIFM